MLSDTKIRKTNKAGRISDQGGLYLQITETGSKLWRFKYRIHGKEKLMALGIYPHVPLVLARERHAAAKGLLARGIDPMVVRKDEAPPEDAKTTFEWVAAQWVNHWKKNKSAQHVDATWRRLGRNVFPMLGERPIAEMKAPELVKMVKAIDKRGRGDLAKRALETCGQIFRYGVAHGHCERNPAADIKPSDVIEPRNVTNLARIGEAELPGLLRAIEVYQGKVITRLAVKLMALTFVRTSELIGARWEEIDWGPNISGYGGARWNIPKERMKMKAPHIVPLSTQALEVLDLIAMLAGSGRREGYLFPGEQDPSKPMSNNTILQALKRMGYGGVMTGHGFRGLASTLLHEQGWPHDHIELQLAHAPRNAVSAAYNHALYLEPRAKMMQAWGDYLEAKLRGK